jgi:hypothetical protein
MRRRSAIFDTSEDLAPKMHEVESVLGARRNLPKIHEALGDDERRQRSRSAPPPALYMFLLGFASISKTIVFTEKKTEFR